MRLIHSNCNIATSGANSYPIESANLNLDLQTYSSQPRTSLQNTSSSPVSIPVSFTTASTFMGMFMCIARAGLSTSALNITVNVKKNGASQGIKTFPFNDVCVDAMTFHYFDFSDLNITTSAGDTWTVEYSYPSSTTYPLICRGTGGASDFFYAVCTNANTTNLAAGEEFFVKQDVTFTLEQSFTMATNAQKRGIFLGRDATFQVADTASPITITANSRLVLLNAKVKVGTVGSPFSLAGQFIWDASGMTAGYQFIEGTSYSNGALSRCEIEFYGAKYTNARIRLTADTAVGANVFNVDTDVTGDWAAGDTIIVYGKDQNNEETQTFVIDSLTATQITTTTNVATNKYLSGGAVVNASKYTSMGVVLVGTGGGLITAKSDGVNTQANDVGVHKLTYSGVGLLNTAIQWRSSLTSGSVVKIDSVISRNTLSNAYAYSQLYLYGNQRGSSISDLHLCYNSSYNYACNVEVPAITINKLTIRNTYTSFYVNSNNATVNDIVATNGYTSGTVISYSVLKFTGAKINLSNAWLLGSNGPIVLVGAVNFIGTNIVGNGGNGYMVGGGSSTSIATFNNCDFGKQKAPAQGTVYLSTDSFHQFTFNNCYFNHANVSVNVENTYDGSFVRSLTHNNTANDYRSWYKYGKFLSTASTIKATNNDTANTLINEYNASTGDVSGTPIRVAVTSDITSSNYYGGTHVLPTLEVEHSGGTIVTDASSATTDPETQSVSFTPSSSYKAAVIRLKQQSDTATEADREVAYSNLSVTMRPYGKEEYSITKVITRTTDDVFFDIIPGAVNPIITQTDKTVVAAYTGIAVNHGTQQIAVTSAHTSAELYDYCQYDLGLEANLDKAKFFYSVDGGLSFNSAYDLSISGGNVTTTKTLRMGTGKVHISNGAYWTGPIDGDIEVTAPGTYVLKLDGNTVDFTAAGSYSFSGSTIASTVTLTNSSGGAVTLTVDDASKFINTGPNITLAAPPVERGQEFAPLLTGSQVKVFVSGTDTEIFSTNNSSTSESWNDATGGEITVDYVIQKAGYIPIRVTGVTLTGATSGGIQSVPISQQIDRSYVASSGLTINTNAFANASTKKFGLTTASTVQNFYSYMIEQWIALGDSGEAFANKPFPIESNGPNSFSFKYGWEWDTTTYPNSITNLSRDGLRYLDTNGTQTAVWAAILTASVPAGAMVRYQQSDGGTTQQAAVTSGNMDELVPVYGDSTHGNFDYRGYLVLKVQEMGYDQVEADVIASYGNLEDQLYVIGLAPTANTVATGDPGITGVTITDHAGSPVTWNSKAFSITITDSGTNSGTDIMKWLRYNFEQGGAFEGKDAFNWHDLVQQNGSAFKTVRGKVYGDTGAALKGVRVLRGTEAHPDFTLFTADDGTTYAPPVLSTVSVSGLSNAVGAENRLQIINVTASSASAWQAATSYAQGDIVLRTAGVGTENTAGLFMRCTTAGTSGGSEPTWNTTPGGTTSDGTAVWSTYKVLYYDDDPASTNYSSSYTDGNEFKTGETYEVRFAEMDGSTSFKKDETTGIASSSGITVAASPSSDDVYAENGFDGSTFDSVFSPNYTDDYIVMDTNTDFSGKGAYAYYCYLLTTSQGMYEFWNGITALDSGNYRIETDVVSLYFDETNGFVKQTDSVRFFRKDGTRPAIDPTTGGKGIEINWRVPVNTVSVAGSSVITGDISEITPTINAIKSKTDYIPSKTVASKLDIESL